jgi:methylated-DNA-[protein]-cysteine S-methyltransferase
MKQAIRQSVKHSYATTMKSPLGLLTLVGNGKALTAIRIAEKPVADKTQLEAGAKDAVLSKAKQQLERYFAGKLSKFDVPMEPQGTPFQKRVWKALSKIPFGKTASYKDVAVMIGNPKACRAVGTANGRNPLCIVVPCHRVISNDGSLGGYTGGLSKKRYLLSLEAQDE